MTVLFDYLLQASIILAVFYVIYFLILRNERFFMEVRIYLVISIFLSVLLPFVKIPYTVIVDTVQSSLQADIIPMLAGAMNVEPIKQNYFTIPNLLFAGYLLVVLVLLIRSLLKISQICRIILGKEYTLIDDCKIVVLDKEIPAFTFFGYIVMNRDEFTDESLTNILAHEKVHAEQKHWIDLLLIELLTIIVWFNPIVWLYQIAIKQTHELLADDGVIARGFNIGQYQATLINQLMETEVLGLANNFNHSITKKRMIMMSKVRSPKNRRYKLLIVIPVVFAILLFNMQIVEVQAQEKKIEKVVNVLTISGQLSNELNEPLANITILGSSQDEGAVSDDLGRFSLLATKDAKLVFCGEDMEKMIISVNSIIEHAEKTESGYFMKINMRTTSLIDQNEENTYRGDPIFVIVEEMPEYPEGALKLKEFYATAVSKLDLKYLIGKRCYVTFIVTKTGEVADARIARSTGNDAVDAKALEIVMSSPKWKPGKQRGQTVHVSYTVPINFSLKEKPKNERRKSQKTSLKYNNEDVYASVEQMPKFPGGQKVLQKYIAESVKYPTAALEKGISGRVFVTFVVNREGNVDQAYIARGVESSLDAEAIRVINTIPKWKPGYEKGKAVCVSYTVPINFDFEDDREIHEDKVTKEVDMSQMDGVAPQFPGGDLALQKCIARNVKYPKEAQEKGETGRVFVTFIINKLGAVESVRTAKRVSPSLDAEAIRVIKSLPNWIPGSKNGESVEATYTLPINFNLNDDQGIIVVDKPKNKRQKYKGEDIFVIVEQMPEYPGGPIALRKYIEENVRYPAEAVKNNISGRVFVTFVVNREGNVDQAYIARGVESSLDAEAIRVINTTPKWKPGYEKGKAVNVSYTVPINFALTDDEKK